MASNSPDHQIALESVAVSATVPCVREDSWRLQPGTDGNGRGSKRRTTSSSACSRHPRCASSSCSTIVAATGCPLSEASAARGGCRRGLTGSRADEHHVQTARLSSRTRARGGTSQVDQSWHAQRSSCVEELCRLVRWLSRCPPEKWLGVRRHGMARDAESSPTLDQDRARERRVGDETHSPSHRAPR